MPTSFAAGHRTSPKKQRDMALRFSFDFFTALPRAGKLQIEADPLRIAGFASSPHVGVDLQKDGAQEWPELFRHAKPALSSRTKSSIPIKCKGPVLQLTSAGSIRASTKGAFDGINRHDAGAVQARPNALLQTFSNAWLMSAMMSSACSIPMDRRTYPGVTPVASWSLADSWEWVVVDGWIASERASPILATW